MLVPQCLGHILSLTRITRAYSMFWQGRTGPIASLALTPVQALLKLLNSKPSHQNASVPRRPGMYSRICGGSDHKVARILVPLNICQAKNKSWPSKSCLTTPDATAPAVNRLGVNCTHGRTGWSFQSRRQAGYPGLILQKDLAKLLRLGQGKRERRFNSHQQDKREATSRPRF